MRSTTRAREKHASWKWRVGALDCPHRYLPGRPYYSGTGFRCRLREQSPDFNPGSGKKGTGSRCTATYCPRFKEVCSEKTKTKTYEYKEFRLPPVPPIGVKGQKDSPRAESAGKSMARALIEMVHLMYQNNTARNFFKGLKSGIDEEVAKRINTK